ncbi:unnamed protein product [Strongylus vulgaris]|uniref:Uncharacterized protein n=1 Tax=Strongylus vulgaris TaxID=40348 RepID=A0A3P7I7D2_STRVU|nr:unnamed protein product [Strongylus vulgaris]
MSVRSLCPSIGSHMILHSFKPLSAHPPPHPQFIPQDGGGIGGPHHQSGPGVYGQCDGNFDKEKVPYDGPSPYHRSSRFETDPSAMSGDPMMYNRAQPMMINQNHPPSGRYEDSGAPRMMPPPVSGPNPSSGLSYSQISGYYGQLWKQLMETLWTIFCYDDLTLFSYSEIEFNLKP